MNARYYMLEIREIPGEVIDIRTRRPVQIAALPPAEEPIAALSPAEEPSRRSRLFSNFWGLFLDTAASLAIIALCAAFWMELFA